MAYQCSMRIQPLKMKDLNKVHVHNKREIIQPHVNEKKSHLNESYSDSGDLRTDLKIVIKRYGMNDKRSTNVACEMILTANHEWFDEGTLQEQEERLQEWIDKNIKWLRDRYGDALIWCDLHLDETAPHFHAVIAAKATYTKRYRHGEKEVTRIAYNKIFGDTVAVIAKARKENNSELTKTGRLQSEYAEAMSPLGLERGTYNSFAVNQKTSEWREITNADPTADIPKPCQATPKPDMEVLSKKEIEQWADCEVANAHKYVKSTMAYAAQKESEAKKALVHEKNSKAATHVVTGLRDDIRGLEDDVNTLKDQLSKERIGTLRKIPVELVAQSCNYNGEINPRKHRNAIDFLMDTEKMEYNDAIIYLNDIFSSEETQDTIRQFYSDATNSVVQSDLKKAVSEQIKNGICLSRQERVTSNEMENQLNALDADEYRITLINEDSSDNSDKHQDEVKSKYSPYELIDPKVVRMLNIKNHKEGFSVFVTPYSQRHSYLVVNDMTAEAKAKIECEGYAFAMISEISPNLIQGVLKVDAEGHSEQKLQELSQELNKEYGDPDTGAHLHLAGFQNRHAKSYVENDKNPFIILKEFTGHICEYAKQKIKEIFFSTYPKGPK